MIHTAAPACEVRTLTATCVTEHGNDGEGSRIEAELSTACGGSREGCPDEKSQTCECYSPSFRSVKWWEVRHSESLLTIAFVQCFRLNTKLQLGNICEYKSNTELHEHPEGLDVRCV